MLSPSHLCLQLVRLKQPDNWAHKGHELGFIFPKGGSGNLDPSQEPQALLPGDVLIVNGAAPITISAIETAELTFWFFSAQLEHLFPLLGCTEISRLHGFTENLRNPRIYPALDPVAVECHRLLRESPPRFDLGHRGHLLRVVSILLAAEFKAVSQLRDGFGTADAHISQLFESLSVTEMLRLSVDELARRFSCSRRHLNRIFHQHFGLSVASLRMEMRLLKAATLLRDPETKVINVAESCGFNHLGLFNTCFKRRFGTTPSNWRRSALASSAAESPTPAAPERNSCRIRENGLCPWLTQSVEEIAASQAPAACSKSATRRLPQDSPPNHQDPMPIASRRSVAASSNGKPKPRAELQ